jgi:transcriptional regulator with XRE-family HTH domain
MHRDTRHRIGRARQLRRLGKTYDEIRAAVGPVRDETLGGWLKGIPRPPATYRSRSMSDDIRRECRRLRGAGLTYGEIAERTGVSQGTLSLWLRDIPRPAGLDETIRRRAEARRLAALRKRSVELNARRAGLRAETVARARRQIEPVGERDLFVTGVALYWAEGAKRKPWAARDRITFVNSDPSIILTWLRWLDLVGVSRERCRFRLQIHEQADIAAAERFWAETVDVPVERLMRTTLKRHRPVTPRRNTGPSYRGCLTIDLLGSAELYRCVEGWWSALSSTP